MVALSRAADIHAYRRYMCEKKFCWIWSQQEIGMLVVVQDYFRQKSWQICSAKIDPGI